MKKIVLICFVFSFPLFAMPKDDFANVLKLAEFSSCENTAYKFDTLSNFDGFGKLVEKELQKKAENLFPWRADVTNGYKEGFFYYALLGYANEISGDIPFAYQCYRNATLYIDEKKSFSFPEPTAEIYLGIARTCLAVGRYMDTKNWLDTAYEYANENPKILAAIDRVAIQKGNELGDYKNIILHYQHLEQLAGRQKTEDRKRITDYRLRTTDYANYAQILFYSRKDREGFSKLLEGISTLGIDNKFEIRKRDVLVEKFLGNIMRADDEEIKYFYDLLGYEIEAARAKAGDENYLAFLCNARTLFCKVYDFLSPEDDLKKVKKRIDKVKKQLKEGYDVFGEKKLSVIGYQLSDKKKNIKSQNRKISKSGEIESEVPEVELENLIMQADYLYNSKKYFKAKKLFERSILLITGKFANIEYDGTSLKNTAYIGLINSYLKSKEYRRNYSGKGIEGIKSRPVNNDDKEKALKLSKNIVFDNSMRHLLVALELHNITTNKNQRDYFSVEESLEILPRANIQLLKFLANKAASLIKQLNYEEGIPYLIEYEERAGGLWPRTGELLSALYLAHDETSKAFEILLRTMRNLGWNDENFISYRCSQLWSCSTEKDLVQYARDIRNLSFSRYLFLFYDGISKVENRLLNNRLSWAHEKTEKELELRELFRQEKYDDALVLLNEAFANSKQLDHLLKHGIALTKRNKKEESYDYFTKAYLVRKKYCDMSGVKINNNQIPELSYLNSISNQISVAKWNSYTNFLEKIN